MSARRSLASAFVLSLAWAACASPARAPEPATPVPPAPPVAAPPEAAPAPPPAPPPTDDAEFEAFEKQFMTGLFRIAPVDATNAGDHDVDDQWPDVSPQGDEQRAQLVRQSLGMVMSFRKGHLGVQDAIDAELLFDQLRYMDFTADQLKPLDNDPSSYTDLIGEGFDPLANRNFQTPDARLKSVLGRLDHLPALLDAARARLQHPSRVSTETAIDQMAGLIDFVEHDLPARFPNGGDPLAQSSKRAAAALRAFQTFLKTDLLPRADGSFRLGREKFARKLAFVLEDDVDIDALAAQARAFMAQTQVDMLVTATQIWNDDKLGKLPPLDTPAHKHAFIKKVLDHVAADRPTNKTIVDDAKTWLAKATAFVREHDLVRVPDDPVAVIEMPEYRRGVAVAYCDSSGPLEKTPETFFAISPTPKDWPAARVASFYREYNESMLADLSIHEAMPGHYLQLMHNNRFPSKLRAMYSSGAFVEGWAVYSEWLMAHTGFGGPRVKLEQQKMALRMAANTILDHDIHAGQMDEAQARALMIGEAYQEDGEATGKWRRARLSSAQLTTYFYGYTQLAALRQAAEQKPGFSERAYHDKLLSFGSPALKFVRQLMATP